MTSSDFRKYFHPAIMNVMGKHSWHSAGEFADAIGLTQYQEWLQSDPGTKQKRLSPKWKRILVALAGPHGKTLFKVVQINKKLGQLNKKGGKHDNRGNEQILDASTAEPFPR